MNPGASGPVLTSLSHARISAEEIALAARRIGEVAYFDLEDVDLLVRLYFGAPDERRWCTDAVRRATMRLPNWFQHGLEPFSEAYRIQQMRVWNSMSGLPRTYDALSDEQTDDLLGDPIRRPAYYQGRGPDSVRVASDHILATGMILKHCGLAPGSAALEYGAGYAQTALALARLGVAVDTVDISPEFCAVVRSQAEFFQVPLTAFQGQFGWNPRPGNRYDLIFFYESFHHCLSFDELVNSLRANISPDGRVILAGEPIPEDSSPVVPYPWGIRLDSECVAVIRRRHWMELGFRESFFVDLFVARGFKAEKHICPHSAYATLWLMTPRSNSIQLGRDWLCEGSAEGWHARELNGRWSRRRSSLLLDRSETFRGLEVSLRNHHPVARDVTLIYGEVRCIVRLDKGAGARVPIDASVKARQLVIECEPLVPAKSYPASSDQRELGMFVEWIRYV